MAQLPLALQLRDVLAECGMLAPACGTVLGLAWMAIYLIGRDAPAMPARPPKLDSRRTTAPRAQIVRETPTSEQGAIATPAPSTPPGKTLR